MSVEGVCGCGVVCGCGGCGVVCEGSVVCEVL